MKYREVKVENIQNKFQMGTFLYKFGLIYYNNVVCILDIDPRYSDASRCIPSEVAPKSCYLLMLAHLSVNGMLYISSTLCPSSPTMYSRIH